MEGDLTDQSDRGPLSKAPSLVVRRLAGIDDGAPGRSNSGRSAAKATWLNAYSDPVAGISAYTQCVHLCNLYGDGDWKLVIADSDKKLKVWAGTQKLSEHALIDTPVAIASFISDTSTRQPSLAVAAGSHIFIYRNLRPYYKFVLPPEEVNSEEQETWKKVMGGDIAIGDALTALTQLQEGGVVLSTRSLQLLNIGDPQRKLSFIEQWQGQPVTSSTVVTCMDVIKQAIDEPDAKSCLVVGTESGRILILNSAGTAAVHNMSLGLCVTPAFLAIEGELDVGYRIIVAARDGKVYTIRNGNLQLSTIQLETAAVGLVQMGGNIIVACMNDTVHSYKSAGTKNYSLYMPCPVLAIQRTHVTGSRMVHGLLVALKNGETRLYKDKTLISVHSLPSPVTAMCFGRYGREDNTLITVTKSGLLDIKILPRAATLDVPYSSGPPPEQEIPLQIPKKTKLYVEQTQRERDHAVDMHRQFQKGLARLRLTTARAYVKILTDGKGSTAFTSAANLSLNLAARGLGPRFRLVLTIRNDGTSHIHNLPVMLSAPKELYKLSRSMLTLPFLAPTIPYTHEVVIECIDPAAAPGNVTVMLLSPGSVSPLLQAQLRMPMSEPEED